MITEVDNRFLHGVPLPPDYFKDIAASVIVSTGNPNIRKNAAKIAYQLLNLGLFVVAGTMSAVWGIESTNDDDDVGGDGGDDDNDAGVHGKEGQERKLAKIKRLRAIARDASIIACTHAAHVVSLASTTTASDAGVRAVCRRATSAVIYATRAMYDEVLALSLVGEEYGRREESYPWLRA